MNKEREEQTKVISDQQKIYIENQKTYSERKKVCHITKTLLFDIQRRHST